MVIIGDSNQKHSVSMLESVVTSLDKSGQVMLDTKNSEDTRTKKYDIFF